MPSKFNKSRARRRLKARDVPKCYAVIEDPGPLWTVVQTCIRNDTPGMECPDALWCNCESYGNDMTVMSEVRSYDTPAAAHACCEAYNEPLLFNADGSRKAPSLAIDRPKAALPSGLDDDDVPF